jgi:hypothetical protein
MTRRKIEQDDVLAQGDPTVPSAGEGCPAVQPLGQESDVLTSPADRPLEKLRGSVLRYDNPTDPVWPIETESD